MSSVVLSPRSSARHAHIYEYASVGPPRYTLLFILASVSTDEDLWPAWASSFYATLTNTCKDILVANGLQHSHREQPQVNAAGELQPLRPCFRELRPQSHLRART